MADKNIFQIKISGLAVEIQAESELARDFCEGFIVEQELKKADLIACADENDIKAEIGLYDIAHSREYCELACIYRSIAEQIPALGRFVFHGAAIKVDGKGYIFTAPPGTGKSTHISLWKQRFGDKVTVINGDKPILQEQENGFLVCSTPWAGKEAWKTNVTAPLGAVCLLVRGMENRITKIDPSKYFEELIGQIYVPKDGGMMLKTLEMLDKLANTVPFYRIECNISEEAAQVAYDMMIENKK